MAKPATGEVRRLPHLLELSDAGLTLLKRLEGKRLNAYRDSGGLLTIGYGHLMQPGEPTRIDEAEATRLLRVDVARTEKAVRDLTRVPLWQSEYDALVLFVFNIGAEAFARSTMRKWLKSLNYQEASHEFARWVFVNRVTVKGLVKRREAERSLFNTVPF